MRISKTVLAAARIAALLFLTACISPISQLTLAPTLGTVLSSKNHATMISLTFLLGFDLVPWMFPSSRHSSPSRNPPNRATQILPIWSFYIPLIQVLLIDVNDTLGAVGGAIVNGFLSCHVANYLSANILGIHLKNLVSESIQLTPAVRTILLITSLLAHRLLEATISNHTRLLLYTFNLTPLHLQLLLALSYTLLLPQWTSLLALPAISHALLLNPHLSLPLTNHSLAPYNYTLFARHWSPYSYISILLNTAESYTLLRSDHSLLGGEFHLTPHRQTTQSWHVSEPIYAVFSMLEAVRLVHTSPPLPPDSHSSALVIGLGIGTAPSALISHGIATTIVELDPIIHRFATAHFNLPVNHTAVIADALLWTRDVANLPSPPAYTYILHDVFTGGVEPLALFTRDFLTSLRMLLAPNGVVAINYAGDPYAPLTRRVVHTIQTVFGNTCRAFSDVQSPSEASAEAEGTQVNIVIFCLHPSHSQSPSPPSSSPSPFTFRPAVESDFLHSLSRRHYLRPRDEQELLHFRSSSSAGLDVLTKKDLSGLQAEQFDSARRHWGVMRGAVVPGGVWERW